MITYSLYCNACEAIGSSFAIQAKLLVNGRDLQCGDSLKQGTYENIALAFCLPHIEDILKAQGLTKESFLSLTQSEVRFYAEKILFFFEDIHLLSTSSRFYMIN